MALSGDSTDTTEGYGSTAGTQAQKLLGALKAFIVPIVRATQASKSGEYMTMHSWGFKHYAGLTPT